jgi:V8-like Glu-specific endopeptidase
MVAKQDTSKRLVDMNELEPEPESPFLDEAAYAYPAGREAWHDRWAAPELQLESPFQSAFEEGAVLSPEKEQPEPFDEGELFSESEAGIIDGDNRVRVKKTVGVPWRWICKVSLKDNRNRYHSGGTGVLVSDRHVLTAAHIVYEEYTDPYKYSIEVTPALGDEEKDEPFDSYAVSAKPKIPRKYDPKAKDHLDWDYALITLNKRVGGKKFSRLRERPLYYWGHPTSGTHTIFARLDPRTLNGKAAITAGYPERKGGRQLWLAAGILHSADVRRRTMWIAVKATKGQSGSPVWIQENGKFYLVGVAAGADEKSTVVVRVTDELIRQLQAWIREDGDTPTMGEIKELVEVAEYEPDWISRNRDFEFGEPEGESREEEEEAFSEGEGLFTNGASDEEAPDADEPFTAGEEALTEEELEPEAEEIEEAFLARDQTMLDPGLVELQLIKPATTFLPLPIGPRCYKVEANTSGPPSIGFEFDLSYGASKQCPPLKPDRHDAAWLDSVYSLEGKNITTHRIRNEGFRLEGDGNRIEIATKPFELSAAGRKEMKTVVKAILELVVDFRKRCRDAPLDTSQGYPATIGAPRHFTPPYLEAGIGCIFPLAFDPRKSSYYRDSCSVAASPQATFSLPLAKVDVLVTLISKSETRKRKGEARKVEVAGRALSGPPGERQGDRSIALYHAQQVVNESRRRHLTAKTQLSDGSVVTEANYSATLQGLLILMVSYLRTSELTYDARDDWEIFAKGYLPLNVKNPFRLLFDDLTPAEKRVFRELYASPRTNLWRLAKEGATSADGNNKLFPARVWAHQGCWFNPVPTWDDLVEKTITNTRLLRNQFCTGKEKKGEDVSCEVLFAPLSRILPYERGSRRVAVEMRRLGFNWVFSHSFKSKKGVRHPGWTAMTEMLFDMAIGLNK